MDLPSDDFLMCKEIMCSVCGKFVSASELMYNFCASCLPCESLEAESFGIVLTDEEVDDISETY